MKLSKQERIAALVILAIVILALGGFLLVKPKFEEISGTQATLETREKELAAAKQRQQLKNTLRMEIEMEYEEGAHLADMFFPELTSYGADNAFREFIKQLDIPVVVEEITVEEPTVETLSVSFYTPTEVSYALKSYVSHSAELTEEERKAEERNQALRAALESQQQTIGASNVSFTVTALSLDDMLAFIDAINDYKIKEEGASEEVRKAISIDSMAIDYDEIDQVYNFVNEASINEMTRIGRELLRELGLEDENQQPLPPEEEEMELDIVVTYEFSETLTFYCIERMQDPKAILDAQDGVISDAA